MQRQLKATNHEQDREDLHKRLKDDIERLRKRVQVLEDQNADKQQIIGSLQHSNQALRRMAADSCQKVAQIAATISQAFKEY